MSRWTWACASHVGTSHLRSGQRLQDAYSCFSVNVAERDYFVGVVSDGAGSAKYGGEGASLVCRTMSVAARRFLTGPGGLPSPTAIEFWVDEARDRIYKAASNRGAEVRDFAATLVFALSVDGRSVFAHVGDGCAVARSQATGEWIAPTWPDHGEYASMTSFVTDQPVAKVRITVVEESFDVIALFSDGIERMVLDMATRKPAERFFSVVSAPIINSRVPFGKDSQLSAQLRDYLGSEQVCNRTDDDKTLLLAALR